MEERKWDYRGMPLCHCLFGFDHLLWILISDHVLKTPWSAPFPFLIFILTSLIRGAILPLLLMIFSLSFLLLVYRQYWSSISLAFGFTAALLESIPILGLIFTISNRVGAAMWAHGEFEKLPLFNFLSAVGLGLGERWQTFREWVCHHETASAAIVSSASSFFLHLHLHFWDSHATADVVASSPDAHY